MAKRYSFNKLPSVKVVIIMLILIFGIDIVIRLWFKLDFYLVFPPSNFSDISIPIITGVGLFIGVRTLLQIRNQNQIRISEDHFNHFNHQISKLKKNGKKNIDDSTVLEALKWLDEYPNLTLSPINFRKVVSKIIRRLRSSKEFGEDLQLIQKGVNPYERKGKFPLEISYWSLLELLIVDLPLMISSFHFKVRELITEIKKFEELTNSHRQLLISTIKLELLADYISFCKSINHPKSIDSYNFKFPSTLHEKPMKTKRIFDGEVFKGMWNFLKRENLI